VTPIVENDQVIGYTSVRVQATRDAIAQAEQRYAEMREGRNKRLYLDKGRLRQKGGWQRLKRIRLDTIRAKLIGMVVVAGALLMASGGLGLYGLNVAGERLGELNAD
jgi:methyl-accepting chemotaxis protein/aerotaxis receptor